MLVQKYYLFPGIQKLKNYLIIQDMVVYICKYYQILGCHNNWIIMYFLNNRIDEADYEQITLTVPLLDQGSGVPSNTYLWELSIA